MTKKPTSGSSTNQGSSPSGDPASSGKSDFSPSPVGLERQRLKKRAIAELDRLETQAETEKDRIDRDGYIQKDSYVLTYIEGQINGLLKVLSWLEPEQG